MRSVDRMASCMLTIESAIAEWLEHQLTRIWNSLECGESFHMRGAIKTLIYDVQHTILDMKYCLYLCPVSLGRVMYSRNFDLCLIVCLIITNE